MNYLPPDGQGRQLTRSVNVAIDASRPRCVDAHVTTVREAALLILESDNLTEEFA